ncbi:thiol reductant ABC exporter subunit CydC [Enterococcus rivorum]|uniref:Thiol reductant ABC exporter subunit CydC n=1 Tax=Enterococcus rivorum TaxID=762845 RepID=A0A1E5KZ94_9ENTE|nr:thiol reductant ABC exporter subunit CydC [Enterococcus rivorum]MBP2099451.1 ATP-binding cassette subfamily C protein CydC [Enterococcus rivorum]OEH83168.1 thiol reductant ABC exporter subunit CydC [Enterococcus rivorum]
MENTPTNKEWLKQDQWVKPFLKKYRVLLFFAIFLGFLTFFSAGALMFNSGYLISRAASLPENILMIYIPIVLTRAFGISRPVFRYVERLVSHNWVLKMTSDLRLKLYQVLEKDAIFFKSKYQTGDILGLLSEDINHLQNLYLRTIFPTVIAWILYVFLIIGLGLFSWWFGLCMLLLLGIAIFLLPAVSVLVNGARQEKQKVAKNELYKNLTDNILGVSDWVFSQRGKEFVHSYEKEEMKLHQIDKKIKDFNHLRDFLLQVLFGGITIAVLAWASIRFPGNHGGAANWIAAFVLTVFPLIDAFAPLPAAAQETTIYRDSIKRLNELPEPQQSVQEDTPILLENTKIEIKDVTFSYKGSSKKVLNQLNLTIEPKEKLAILGRSGSGKSTLATLIRGDLTPNQGELLLGGVPTASFGDRMTESIGVIHQTPYLFHTTILNNIRIGKEEASEEEVWQVIEQVGLKEMIEKLPDGLQTMVDEAGLRFSGGERHRLALARILLQDTPIVLLDEPTTGLDPITEQQLLDTFFDALSEKTIIWITHHLQGIQKMDRVIFIEDGLLEMSGTPAQLLKENTHYQELYAIDRGTN